MTRRMIFVCSNHETLRDGLISSTDRFQDEINVAISDTCRLIDDAGHTSKADSTFSHWHGGKFARAGKEMDAYGNLPAYIWGYRNGHIALLCVNPTELEKAVVDQASNHLDERLNALGKLEDAEHAAH